MTPLRNDSGPAIQYRVSERRKDAVWLQVARGLDRPTRVRPWVWALATTAIVIGVGAGLLRSRQEGPAEGAVVEVTSAGEQQVALPEGSRLTARPQTRLSLTTVRADEIRLRLDRGAIALSVSHLPRRPFTVEAGPFEVRVVGTVFSVRRDRAESGPDRVTVEVTSGRVTVQRRDDPDQRWSVSEGERWSTSEPILPPTPPPAPPPVLEPPVVTPPAAERPAPPPRKIETRSRRRVAMTETPRPAAPPDELHSASVERLFAMAAEGRRRADPAAAARAFDAIRRRFRTDPRAALAAFELGRLRLDALGDARGAVEALNDALALEPEPALQEHVEARRIEALGSTNAQTACQAARAAYRARWPKGVHAAAVEGYCRER